MSTVERDNRIDSLKGVLISFVVLGHCLLWGGQKSSVANWIYLFHMPFFVFLSGYLSHADSRSYWKGVLAIAESYIVYQLIKSVLYFYSPIALVTTPASMMWYLFALMIWRCLYYIWNVIFKQVPKKTRNRLNIVVAVVLVGLGLAVGMVCPIGKTFALSRMIVFFPFFWLGTMAQGSDFISLCTKMPRWSAILILLTTLAFIVWLTPQGWIDVRETVRCVKCYDMLGGTMIGLVGRATYYILAIVISIALTCLLFENKIVNLIGKDSLKYYLFHGVILRLMDFAHLPWTWWLSVIYFVIIMVSLYFFNKTKLSDFAIRPITYTLNLIKSKKTKQ